MARLPNDYDIFYDEDNVVVEHPANTHVQNSDSPVTEDEQLQWRKQQRTYAWVQGQRSNVSAVTFTHAHSPPPQPLHTYPPSTLPVSATTVATATPAVTADHVEAISGHRPDNSGAIVLAAAPGRASASGSATTLVANVFQHGLQVVCQAGGTQTSLLTHRGGRYDYEDDEDYDAEPGDAGNSNRFTGPCSSREGKGAGTDDHNN